MTAQQICPHTARSWTQPEEFVLRPAVHTGRGWRYAHVEQVCSDCGEPLRAFRVDLRGLESLGRHYRIVFEENRVREGNGYRLVAARDEQPHIVLTQCASVAGPSFDVDPPIPCTAIVAAFEDDYPFALVREVTLGQA